MEQEIQLNGHNKQEYPPMHTAEHILNQTMIRMFGCERSKNTHIERKKSKCDYILSVEPTAGNDHRNRKQSERSDRTRFTCHYLFCYPGRGA